MIIIIYFREMLTDGQWLTIHLKKVFMGKEKKQLMFYMW